MDAKNLDFYTMTVLACGINSVHIWQAYLCVPGLHFLALAPLNKTHRSRPCYISIAQSLPQISGIWCHVLFFAQLAPENTEFTLFISFSGEIVGIGSNRCVSPGPRGGAPTFFLTDAVAPPFAGSMLLNSMRENSLRRSKRLRENHQLCHTAKISVTQKLRFFRIACLVA